MDISGLRVIGSDWTAKQNGTAAELTLHVQHPETDERVSLTFYLDQEQVFRMVQAYCGRLI